MAYTKLGRVRPTFRGAWSSGVAYSALEIVQSSGGGLAYIARKDVPAGKLLTDTDYWAVALDVQDVIDAAEAAAATVNRYSDIKANALSASDTGNPVDIYPDAGSILKPVLKFGPAMAGSGDPSPDNPRAIGEYTTAHVSVSGRNLANTVFVHGTRGLNGVLNDTSGQIVTYEDLVPVAPGSTIYASSELGAFVNVRYYFYNDRRELVLTDIGNPTTGLIVPDNACWFALQKSDYDGYAEYVGKAVMVDIEPITEFAPYNGSVAAAELGRDVYGGTLDWNAGTLTVDKGLFTVTADSVNGHSTASGGTADVVVWINGSYQSSMLKGDSMDGWCSHFVNGGSTKNINTVRFGANTQTIYFYVSSADFADADAFRTFVAEQETNGTPLQVVYPLASPVTVQLDTDQLLALSGMNRVCASANGMNTGYNKDLARAIEDMELSGGSAGEDGGYYTPTVASDGTLTWTASKDDMPAAASANIKGPTGKTAYQYAKDGGFTGTETEFSAKLAIPVITPEMYGAVGDGTTDDSAAIQAAITAAVNAADNAYYLKPVVYLAAKTYKISTGIVLDSRCSQFRCDGILQYDGTGAAVSIKHSLMEVYINQIQAPNGTALYLTGEEHQCVTNNVTVNRIESSVVGIHLYNGGEANSVFYNRINAGPVNSTETCVFIEAQQGYVNENHFWFGKLGGASTGIKIYANPDASATGAGGNRFFKGAFENLMDNTENTRAIWLENTGDNVFRNFRAEENHGAHNVVFKGDCQGNDIGLSFCALGGIDISGLTSGGNNYLRGKVQTGKPYAGGYGCGDTARVDYTLGITYDPKYANIWKQITSTLYSDNVIRQTTDDGLQIPTTFDFDSTVNGKTFTFGNIYSEYGSMARGFPVAFVFGSEAGNILLKDSRGGTILDNLDGKYAGKTVIVKWDGFDKIASKNIWAVTISGVEVEITANKTNLISSASTDKQYPTAKAVYDALESVEADAPNFDLDENGHLVILPSGAFTNLVPTSVDTDGSVFEDIGYVDGYRISSSGEIKAQTGTVLTGFIPCAGINDSTVIRMKGATFDDTEALYTGLALYDANYALMCCIRYPSGNSINENVSGLVYFGTTGTESTLGSDGVTIIGINFAENVLAENPPAYMRIFAEGSGADMIVTIDEEIKDYETEDVGRIVPIHKGEYSASTAYSRGDVVYYSGASYWHFGEAATKGIAPTDSTVWTMVAQDGAKGDKGDTGATGPAYTLTESDKSTIAAAVKASLTTETWTFTLEDGSTVTKAVYVG